MEYHTKSVKAGTKDCGIMADMPAGSYEHNKETALLNAKKFGCSAQVILYGSNLFKQNFFLRDKFVDYKLPKLFLDAGVEVEQ